MLSIDTYNRNEAAARTRFGNDVLWAFTPVTFQGLGYPSVVGSESELIRYLDPMKEAISRHVGTDDKFFRQYSLRTRFSAAERDEMLWLRNHASDVAFSVSGQRQYPINSVISAIGLFRTIKHVQSCYPERPLRILEVGPGAGYLGALLIRHGFQYTAVDNTQAFYLWQNRMWSGLGQINENAATDKPDYSGSIVHVPWWHYVDGFQIEADIVICEQALCEMHGFATRFTVRKAFDCLKDSPVGLFLYSGPGYTHTALESLNHAIAEFGFHGVLSKCVYGHSAGPRQYPPAFYSLDTEIPVFGGEPVLSAPDILSCHPDQMAFDYDFREYIGLWPAADKFKSGDRVEAGAGNLRVVRQA